MKTEVWCAITPVDILERVDMILPGLIDDDEMKRIVERNRRFRSSRGKAGTSKSSRGNGTRALGVSLVIMGVAMAIPGPVDLAFAAAGGAIGGWLGGPAGAATGAAIRLAIYNIAAVVVIVVGVALIIGSFIGF